MISIQTHRYVACSATALLVLSAALAHAGTIAATFSFQKEDLRKDGELYGSGASYTGVLDGRLTDSTATSALSSTATATVGNQNRANSNGQNFMRLFSYDLTELSDFITANTSENSVVTVTSVSLTMVASGSTVGTSNGNAALFRTDPFTSSANWSTSDGSTPWTTPYQSGRTETAYNYTGGATALTAAIAGSNPSTGGRSAGSLMQWTSSADFIAQLVDAVDRQDKTLYLMATRGLLNSDGRVDTHTSSAASVDDRPELVVTLEVTTTAPTATWTGASDSSWITAGNWSPTNVPATDAPIIFDSSSTANLNTVLNQDFTVTGVTLTSPTGAVSIGGANTLGLGAGGFDLSTAAQDLTVSTPIVLGGTQSWIVASGRTLGVSGSISGNSPLTIAGEGKVLLGASNILPNGVGNGNMIVTGTLDLNGTSQSANGLTGSGIVDNTAVGSATLILGNNDVAGTFAGTFQDTGGSLAVIKTGGGNLTLTGTSDYSGGFTNNGVGDVAPNSSSAFGTGPVISNAGQLYATATTVFANTLALNNSTLRIGGGNNRSITWNGAVTATGTSGISADGGTAGINLGSTLDITGATFSSLASGATVNSITGNISGAGGSLNVTGGTLELAGSNSYNGTTTLGNFGVLRLAATGTISNSSNVVINTSANFTVRNSNTWIYNGTISGDSTGSINLDIGTNAELAGNISGVAAINANSTDTDATISGAISGAANVTVQATGGAILRLSGANDYSGTTTVQAGSLLLAAANVLPDTTAVSLVAGTLDATTAGTETVGTLAVTGAATINLGTGAALVFAGSSAIDWTGGSLNITGAFVPGSSIKIGSDANGLSPEQRAVITVNGGGAYTLDSSGFLIEAPGFAAWQTANSTAGGLDEDHDGDGVDNGVEYFLGGVSDTTGFTALPGVADTGGTLSVTWTKAGGYTGSYGTDFMVETSATLAAGTWIPETLGGNVIITGNDVTYTFPAGTIMFARLRVTGP